MKLATAEDILLSSGYGFPTPSRYEWRYTRDTVERLFRMCVRESFGKHWLAFGTPSVFAHACHEYGQIGRLTLFDSNERLLSILPSVPGRCSKRVTDLRTPHVFHAKPTLVLMDPPWYMDFVLPFLWNASEALKRGGRVVATLFPPETRPNAAGELRSVIDFASECGLELDHVSAGSIGYSTPLFEANALNLDPLAGPWRRGDAYHFLKVASKRRPFPVVPIEDSWTDVQVGGHIISFRKAYKHSFESSPQEAAGIIPLVEGSVVPSVSRRFPGRSLANVWTSGNRAYLLSDVVRVESVAAMHGDSASGGRVGPKLLATSSRTDADPAAHTARDVLRTILELEEQEARVRELRKLAG